MPLYHTASATGTTETDFMLGVAGGSTYNGSDGNDVLVGWYGSTLSISTSGGPSIDTAYSLDSSGIFGPVWLSGENPLLFDNGAVPHTTVQLVMDAGQVEYFSIFLNAGQTITVDMDNSGQGQVDAIVDIVSGAGVVLATDDDSLTTEGGLGSTSATDPFLTYTAPVSTTYYIQIRPFGATTFASTAYQLLNVSVAGHSTVSPTNSGADVFYGGAGHDHIGGGEGNDQLEGGDGDDWIVGGSGADSIAPGIGTDLMTGGSGSDTYFGTTYDFNGDTITDFRHGDKISFSDIGFTTTATLSGNQLSYSGQFFNGFGFESRSGTMTVEHWDGNIQVIFGQVTFVRDAANDFNGDGISDILWRDNTGRVTNWLGQSNGAFASNFANADANAGLDWQIAGTGDFNHDGRDDVLWRNVNTGALTDWLGTPGGGFASNFGNAYYEISTNWQVEGVGDFNGDGRDDILWRDNTGRVTDWLGQGSGGFSGNFANADSNAGLDWQIAGIGDFNNDGRDDILWRNVNSGAITDWLGTSTGGFTSNFGTAYYELSTSWHIIGTGDFNGDGRDDILLRNADGRVTNWLGQGNGGFTGNFANADANAGLDWHIEGIGDYNGDGRDDVLWRNNSGDLFDWLSNANGGFVSNYEASNAFIAKTWEVESPDIFPL